MLSRNAVLVVALAVAEYFVSSRVISALGFGLALLGSFALAFVGISLLRRSMRQAPQALQDAVMSSPFAARSSQPQGPAPDAAIAGLGLTSLGALGLILPGFLSAALGAMLFVPPIRALLKPVVSKRIQPGNLFAKADGSQIFDIFGQAGPAGSRSSRTVVDVDIVDIDDDAQPSSPDASRPELH